MPHWSKHDPGAIIRLVQRRRLIATALWIGLATAVRAQGGDTDRRALAASVRTVAADYSHASFGGDIDPWHMASVSLGDKRSRGSIIGRLNWARRYAINGTQAEIDAYPALGEGMYAYVNLGYSQSEIFPGWRSGAELFRSLPRAYEASLGYRQLRFGGPPVTLLTGSVGRYSGNYWFSLRPYFRDKPTGTSASASVTARRYSVDADNYVGARLGYGTSPTEDVYLSQLARTSSFSAALTASRSATNRTITNWSLSFEREELSPSRFRNRFELGAGIRIRY